MDSLPKLLPTWHDIGLQQIITCKSFTPYQTIYPPSHGGIGTDISCDSVHGNSNNSEEVTVSSNSCALPFMPVKEVNSFEDPCLGSLKKEKFEFDEFCRLFKHWRLAIKNKSTLSNLKSLQQKLKKYLEKDENVDKNIKIRETLLDMSENKPKKFMFPKHNTAYAGGTLAVLKSSNNLNLLHPAPGNFNKLCVTPLKISNDKHFEPDNDRQYIFDVGKGNILQIEPALNDSCCVVRHENEFHLIDVTNKSVYSKKNHNSSFHHIAVSPYNHVEVLSVNEKGVMKLVDTETRNTWSISEDLFDDPSVLYPTWRCGFGSHMFSTLSMNEKKVYFFDRREKIDRKNVLFNIKNPSCYVDEDLIGMRQWNKNPFQHLLTSSHHLMICDERYPKKPVMFWNHTLKDPPVYIECADLSSDVNCILIGTQGTQEVAAFLLSEGTNIQPVFLSPPLLSSSPTDCIESLKLHSYFVNEKCSSRLSYPLTGIGLIPKEKEIAFTVLQSTSLGDIFYQDFKQSHAIEKTYCIGTGCVLTPPEKILPFLQEWISDCNNESDEVQDMHEDIHTLRVDVNNMLSPTKEISSNCALCRSRNFSVEETLILSEICPRCSLNSMESQHFSKAEANLGAVIGPVSEEHSFFDCDLDYLSGFEDTYSKKMLSVWLNSDDLGAS